MPDASFQVWRGDASGGSLKNYQVPIEEGMVVLDAMHWIQGHLAPDLAVRWNCKAAKCGSCSAEVNGKPSLMCKTRLARLDTTKPITVKPIKAFPILKDIVADVKWNYEVNKKIPAFKPREGTDWKYTQAEADRVQEFRKCIECFLCQDVCHVLRDHHKHDEFIGPRFLVHVAALEMHPLDDGDRTALLKDQLGIGLCNITKCCTEVCPEDIHITDNAIIPLKERVVDRFYDPILRIWRALTGKK